jgi:hypothetical protein
LGLAPGLTREAARAAGQGQGQKEKEGRKEEIDLYTIVVRRVWHRYTRNIKISIEINVIKLNNI